MTLEELHQQAMAGMFRAAMAFDLRGECKRRIDQEMKEIKKKGLLHLFQVPAVKAEISLQEAMAGEVSLVAYFGGYLGEEAYPQPPTDDLLEFWRRSERRRASGKPAPTEVHIKALILAGAFGDPAEQMARWCAARGQPMEDLDFEREQARATCALRRVDWAELTKRLKRPPSTYGEFLAPESYGRTLACIGQVVGEVKERLTRKDKKKMLTFSLQSLDPEADEYDEPVMPVVVFSTGMHKVQQTPAKDDLFLVIGRRDVWEDAGILQLVVDKHGHVIPL